MYPRTFKARDFPLPVLVNTRGKRNSPAHGREHSRFASFVKYTKKNPEKKVKDQNSGATKKRELELRI